MKYLVVIADYDYRHSISVAASFDDEASARAYVDGYNSALEDSDIGRFADIIPVSK